jgi:hypothetical protein
MVPRSQENPRTGGLSKRNPKPTGIRIVKLEEEITWERDHPQTTSLIQHLSQDVVKLSKRQRSALAQIVGKMETDLHASKQAQQALRNHIIWHIEKNNQNAAYSK